MMQLMYMWLASVLFLSGGKTGGDLTVTINGFRNSNGYVLVSMYNSASGFPQSAEKAYKKEKAEIKNGSCILTFPSLPEGTYAIAVLHDENKNLKMDMKLGMFPKEGYGFSKDAPVVFGPPSFSKAGFQHDGKQSIVISIKYL